LTVKIINNPLIIQNFTNVKKCNQFYYILWHNHTATHKIWTIR
jgi:hypothetical protein